MNTKFLYLPALAFCFSNASIAMDIGDKDSNSTIKISQNTQGTPTYNLGEDEGIDYYDTSFSSYTFKIKNNTLHKAVEGDVIFQKNNKRYFCSMSSRHSRDLDFKKDPQKLVWMTGVGPVDDNEGLPIVYAEKDLPHEYRTVQWNHIEDVFYNGSHCYRHFKIEEIEKILL